MPPAGESWDGDFGLDVYEPEFYWPIDQWQGEEEPPYNSWTVELTLTDTDYQRDLFYFCHIHALMSGRIKQLNSAGGVLQAADSPALYSPVVATGREVECGAVGLNQYVSRN